MTMRGWAPEKADNRVGRWDEGIVEIATSEADRDKSHRCRLVTDTELHVVFVLSHRLKSGASSPPQLLRMCIPFVRAISSPNRNRE